MQVDAVWHDTACTAPPPAFSAPLSLRLHQPRHSLALAVKALIVDPSRFVVFMLSGVCERHNVACVAVRSGGEALAVMRQMPFDLLSFAYELGDMNGIEFYQQVAQSGLHRRRPAVMFAATHDRAVIERALLAGVTECFSKHQLAEFEKFVAHLSSHGAELRMNGQVLLVEDSATAALQCLKILAGMGLIVEHYKSAEEALQRFANHVFDLVLTDYLLAGTGTGLSVIRGVRASGGRKGRVPILAMSSFADATRRIEILRSGANDFIGKPLIAEELRLRIYNLLNTQRLMRQLEMQHEMMKELALHDPLTSLYNRHYLHQRLPELIDKARAAGRPFSLVIVDVDHFKKINDSHGHAAGDLVLVQIAEALLDEAGAHDLLARFGGEEFIVVMPGYTLAEAVAKAERLRAHIAALAPNGITVTASFGVATLAEGEDYEGLFRRADGAVYRAKNAGRNGVMAACPPG